MAVAEIETDRVISDPFPSSHLDADEILRYFTAIVMPENIALALDLGARRRGAQRGEGKKAFLAIVPADGDFGADDLDVHGGMHGASY